MSPQTKTLFILRRVTPTLYSGKNTFLMAETTILNKEVNDKNTGIHKMRQKITIHTGSTKMWK